MKISASSAPTRAGSPSGVVLRLQKQSIRLEPLLEAPPAPGTRLIWIGSEAGGGRMEPNNKLRR
jgi:hypothetical protein